MSANLKIKPVVGIVGTVGKAGRFWRGLSKQRGNPRTVWISTAAAVSTMPVGTCSFSRNEDAILKTSRWTAEKRDEIVLEMLRGEGIHRPDCPKAQGSRRVAPPMEGTVLRRRDGRRVSQRLLTFVPFRKEIFKYQVALIQFSWVSMTSGSRVRSVTSHRRSSNRCTISSNSPASSRSDSTKTLSWIPGEVQCGK